MTALDVIRNHRVSFTVLLVCSGVPIGSVWNYLHVPGQSVPMLCSYAIALWNITLCVTAYEVSKDSYLNELEYRKACG